jgi:hypothetical protein
MVTKISYRQSRWSTSQPSALLVLLTAVILPAVGCGKADNRVPVHRVLGTIQFQGKPIVGAFVSLHPKTRLEGVPGPRATVAPDGWFAVSTYDGGDGAPEGDYVLTVRWYKPVRQGNDLVGGPNILPAKYASPRTSDVRVTVAAGENRLKPIQLR